jgi:hypothetical protein
MRDGEWRHMDATLLVPGDSILLAAGAAILADHPVLLLS